MDKGGSWRLRRVIPLVVALTIVAVTVGACSKSNDNGSSSGGRIYNVFVQKFRFHGMPSSLASGNFTVNFTNRESFPINHEMVMIGIPSGKSTTDVMDAAKSKGPASEDMWLHFGEIPDVFTGATKSQVFDLPPGNYAIACWQTGTANGGENGPPHVSIGMIFPFTVK
ncbi:MAG: hypothetical protein M3P01_11925 [Actinomycetota bacterium]|nr:hypothetical protein [Actinomycetota bacterium]